MSGRITTKPSGPASKTKRVAVRSGEPQRRGPGSRADEHHPTRHELLDAARRVAASGTVGDLTVASITEEAGLGKGTFYVHFVDRLEVLTALHREFHDVLFDGIAEDTADLAPGPHRARARLIAFLDRCRSEPAVRCLLFDARHDPAITKEVQRRNHEAATILAVDLRRIRDADPKHLASLLVAAAVEVAALELALRRRQPALRAALCALVPD